MSAADRPRRWRAGDQRVIKALVIALTVVMRDELAQGALEVAFPQGNHPRQAFVCDRAHEPFGVSVGIGRLKRRLDQLDA